MPTVRAVHNLMQKVLEESWQYHYNHHYGIATALQKLKFRENEV